MMTKADISSLRHPGLPIVLINCPFVVPGYRRMGPSCGRRPSGGRPSAERPHGTSRLPLITGETGVHGRRHARLDGAMPC